MKLLIAGRTGQIARALARRAASASIDYSVIGRPEFDLETFSGALPNSPTAVINAAAYTQVDRAEDEPDLAMRVNATGAGELSRAATGADVFVHFSTDYVFAGDKASPYVEADGVDPINRYGVSKLAGERAVMATNPRSVILRTAWVYDSTGANFVRTMLNLAKTRDEIGVVSDQVGCPSFASDLADVALQIALRPGPFGIYHCAGAGETSWATFAEEIFALSRTRGGPSATVRPILAAEYPTRARRPTNSRLDCSKLSADYGLRMRPWRVALAECVDEMAANGWA